MIGSGRVSMLCAFVLAAMLASMEAQAVMMRPARPRDLKNAKLFSRQAAEGSGDSSPKFTYGTPSPNYPGVVAKGKMGKTNPQEPKMNTPINQNSMARLASVNSIDDWCTFGPPGPDKQLGDVEQETVAWCTKPRNNARVIPDGTVTSAHFVKTPLYVQIMALGDFTKIGFQPGDTGGELDPHGATGKGNPVGGNVTSNVSGKDVFYQEWMNYVGYNVMCIRVCTAGSDQAKPKDECRHTLDEVGCPWIMPGVYAPQGFDTCDADAAYPPGVYVTGGSTSTFEQYATGLYTANGKTLSYTNGDKNKPTPAAAQSMPASSNCQAVSTISNGIKSIVPTSEAPQGDKKGGQGSQGSQGSKGKSGSSGSGSNNGAAARLPSLILGALVAAAVGGVVAL